MNKSIFLSIGASALLICACAQNASKKEAAEVVEAEAAPVVPTVEVRTAVVEKVAKSSVYSSTVLANVQNNIAPQSAGRIQKINVEVGDFVQAGDILAEMDRVQLDQAQLRLKNSEIEYERVKGLFEEGGISRSDFDQIELSYKVSKSTYANLEENTILRSPVDGVITARNYDRGDMYAMAQPIFTLQQITPVKILVAISETDYTRVKKGDRVTITADAFPGQTFSGTIARLYPVMDAASHTFNVEVKVPNVSRTLRPGMYVRATVTFGVDESVTVPDLAVQKQQGSGVRNAFVYNPADGTVSLRTVTLGLHVEDKYEILSGVAAGEQVVTKGFASLRDGIKVNLK